MLCAAVVAMPFGTATVSAFAQSNLDPELGTPCSRSGLEPCGSATGLPWLWGGRVYQEHRPVYPHWRNSRSHQTRRGAHEEWCYGTYRSYRAWDNTFKPYHGPREQCYSPYG
jgi:hypothetical protein